MIDWNKFLGRCGIYVEYLSACDKVAKEAKSI
jgi:hypothetical protein